MSADKIARTAKYLVDSGQNEHPVPASGMHEGKQLPPDLLALLAHSLASTAETGESTKLKEALIKGFYGCPDESL